jgi:hypothetical protein
VNPDYQAAVAALATALPSPPRPLPPWAPAVSLLLTQLVLSVVLLSLGVLFAVESWLRIMDTQGTGDEASVVSVTRQGGRVAYEYAITTPNGGRLNERASAPVAAADDLAPGTNSACGPPGACLPGLPAVASFRSQCGPATGPSPFHSPGALHS